MTHIWSSRHYNKPGDPSQCRASVVPNESFGWIHAYQCTRKPLVFRCLDGAEYGFCKQHDPEAVTERSRARSEKWRLEREQKDQEYDRQKQTQKAMDACKDAIVQIAAGHNDPRKLAGEALQLFPSSVPPADRS